MQYGIRTFAERNSSTAEFRIMLYCRKFRTMDCFHTISLVEYGDVIVLKCLLSNKAYSKKRTMLQIPVPEAPDKIDLLHVRIRAPTD